MKVIVVTGTPGTGKTIVGKKLAKKLKYQYIDVNEIIKTHHLNSHYDKKRQCHVIDIDKLNPIIIFQIKNFKKNKKIKGIIIDSHLSHYLPKKYVDLCIVTKCDLSVLKKRLERQRKYNQLKVRENLDCEIFDICLMEAEELGHRVLVINTTKGINIDRIAKDVKHYV